MQRYNHSRSRGDSGVIAIEFVLILPLILVFLFGIIQFGRAYNAKIELSAAVREGARALALGSGDPATTTADAAPGLDAASITVETSGSPCTSGSPAWVKATYPFSLNIPWFSSDTIQIAAKGVMRCGG